MKEKIMQYLQIARDWVISAWQKSVTRWVTLLIVALLLIAIGSWMNRNTKRNQSVQTEQIAPLTEEENLDESVLIAEQQKIVDEVYQIIYSLKIDHPDIVLAQCILESGTFTSNIYKEGNNCLGMKLAKSRPTTATGVIRGHAKYNNMTDCIVDYAIWQGSFARKLSREEYFTYLDSVYAQDKNYSIKLKEIIRVRKL